MSGAISGSARLAILLGLLLVTARTADAQGVSLNAAAGLAGHVRPGRWTSVLVDVSSSSRSVSGELVVEWGPTRVRRTVSLSPGNVRHLELYVRTLDPRDVITVRLDGDAGTLAEVPVPVRVLLNDPATPALIVCGRHAMATDHACVAGVDVASLPHSWRGFDAADDVRLSEVEVAALDVRQRGALALASAQARLSRSGLGAPTLGAVPIDRRWTQRTTALLGGYAIAFVVVLFGTRYRYAGATLVVLVIVSAIGSAVVIGSGRIGPGAAILVHHASSIDQYEGADSAVLTLRGVAEFPASGQYALHSELEDATLLVRSDDAREIARFDVSGFPMLAGRFGLGSTTTLVLEGAGSPTLLRVAREGHAVRMTNVSNLTLNGCGFAAVSGATADLPPGASLAGAISESDPDPTFTCVLESSPWGLSEARHPVEMSGRTTVVVHLNPELENAAAGSDR
jgi:hypothetical protein